MSSAAASLPVPASAPQPPDATSSFPSRSWLHQVVAATFAGLGARLSLVWICFVGIVGVFAPMLANSHPFLIKIDGSWSSPMLQSFTPTDVTLLVGFVLTLVALRFRRISAAKRVAMVVGAIPITFLISYFTLHPPLTPTYEQYRKEARLGRVQWVLNAPVPYSPQDILTDEFSVDRPHPWAPDRTHWAGTNSFGSDITSHLIHACRIAMAIGFIASAIELVIGVVVGGLMGYFVGWVDLIGMRVVEVFSAIPTIYLLLAFVAVYGRDIYIIMIIIGVTGWVENARFVRAEFLKLRQQDFVYAAVASGLPLRSVIFRHILPNALAPLLVSTSFGVASAILYESTLSFLGLGIQIGEASWGQLLNEAVSNGGGFYWWLAIFPGVAVFFTVLAYNLVGEAVRDALDPKLQSRA